LTKSLAQYGGPRGIRVNCISPGPVLTRAAMANMKTLVGRAAEPQEVVDLVMYLLSDKSSFCTGSNFTIDGGHVCLH
ncbi:MAG: SDR family oxidoreductase, partial [Clostridia bacterium]|nr:SDR family oxidoreductase [Clostridia bacterium]